MENRMFCFPCEQTAGCNACTGKTDVCGEQADTAKLQDQLTGALIGLARATNGNEQLVTASTDAAVLEGLSTTVTNVNFNNETLTALIERVEEEKRKLVPDCAICASPCGRTSNYDLQEMWNSNEDIRSLKSLILIGIRGMAAYAYHAAALGAHDADVHKLLYKALFAIGEDWDMEQLLPIVMEVGQVNLRCMAQLVRSEGCPHPA